MGGSGTGTKSTGGLVPALSPFEVQLAADLANIYGAGEFTKTASYNGPSGWTTFPVIFSAPFSQMNPATGQIEMTVPQAQCRTSDISTVVHGSSLVIAGVTYKVIGRQPLEDGLETMLLLSKD